MQLIRLTRVFSGLALATMNPWQRFSLREKTLESCIDSTLRLVDKVDNSIPGLPQALYNDYGLALLPVAKKLPSWALPIVEYLYENYEALGIREKATVLQLVSQIPGWESRAAKLLNKLEWYVENDEFDYVYYFRFVHQWSMKLNHPTDQFLLVHDRLAMLGLPPQRLLPNQNSSNQ
jgi:hypothetical protein